MIRKIQMGLALLCFGAATLCAQIPLPKPPANPSGAKPAQAPTATRTAAIPSYKDLKYPALRPIQIPTVETYTLPNGMKIYLLEDHELPVVNGTALVRTGNLFDPPDKVGLAGLTGTLIRLGGTRAKTGDQLDQQLENMAASVESSIGETSGSVSFSSLKENTDEVLAIFKDVLTAPEFRQDKIDFAKTQVRSSIARRNDNASGIAQREFADIVYGKDTPYGWREEYATIDRINRADLQGFFRRYFFPANVMLAVYGDFDAAAMKAKLDKLFADWTVTQPLVPAFPKVSNQPAAGTYLAVKKDVTQTFFAMGQLGGELRDKDFPALQIMADILGGGFQSRLVERIRTKMGDAYDISADWGAAYDHPGLFEISGSTKSLSTVETVKAIQEEVDRIRTAEVSDDELKTAKDTALNSMVFAYDTKAKTLNRLLTYEYFGYPKDFILQYQKALAAVTRADVLRVAKEHLDPARFTVVAVGNPQDFGTPLDALGRPVTPIDLTIAAPKQEAAKADATSLAKGKEILQRAQRAVGGADKLAAVTDMTQVATFQISPAAGGYQVVETDRWLAPSYFRQESQLPKGKIAAFWDGKSGWIVTPGGAGALAGAQLKQVQGDLFRNYFRLLLSDQVAGRTVNAIDDATVEIVDPSGALATLGVDLDTGLPRSIHYESVPVVGPAQSVEDTFFDFREVAGVKVPFKIAIREGGQMFADVTVTDLRVNTGLKAQDLGKRP
jgi:zinc protease